MDQTLFLVVAVAVGVITLLVAAMAIFVPLFAYQIAGRTRSIERHMISLLEMQAQASSTLARQAGLIQKQIETTKSAPPASVQSTPPPTETLRICQGEEDIGEIPIATVEAMLTDGRLSRDDHYFDWAMDEWTPLASIAT